VDEPIAHRSQGGNDDEKALRSVSVAVRIAAYISLDGCFSYRRKRTRGDRRITAVDFGEDFQAVHGHVPRRLDAQLYLIAIDADDDDTNVATDHNRFISLTAEH
jgi:hypothetical protein